MPKKIKQRLNKKRKLPLPLIVVGIIIVLSLFKLLQEGINKNIAIPLPQTLNEGEGYQEPIYVKSNNPKVESIEIIKFQNESFYRRFLKPNISIYSPKAPKNKNEIQWVTKNTVAHKNPTIRYSFQFPFNGPYCEGCFDGWPYNNTPSNAEGEWISGGYFDPTNTDRMWGLAIGIIYRKVPQENNPNEPNRYLLPMFENMLKANVGQTITITDEYELGPYKATRLEDLQAPAGTFLMYKTSNNNAMYYALQDQKSHSIIFSYSYYHDVYDVFDTIIKSFIPKIYAEATYGQLAPVDEETIDKYERISNKL